MTKHSLRLRVNEDGDLEKQCTKCGEWYYADTEFFHKSKKELDGLHSWCKACFMEKRLYNHKPKNDKPHQGRQDIVDPFARLLFGEGELEFKALWQQGSIYFWQKY